MLELISTDKRTYIRNTFYDYLDYFLYISDCSFTFGINIYTILKTGNFRKPEIFSNHSPIPLIANTKVLMSNGEIWQYENRKSLRMQ